ncbi:Kelch-like protein 10 [Pseudocercospora fuligena]|uniref:Kelch-like protein 10 n=1 Tax=Pseudocercospora fuligena TaxID=685502 RepID=A0A8H6VNN7_9PEZI|nr:Kelch-like protein 10 [Pseudocercospora fuligena]
MLESPSQLYHRLLTGSRRMSHTNAQYLCADLKRRSEAYDTIVQIKTGEGTEAKVFDVHKSILCFCSGYFRTAFNGRWKEAQEGAIDIPSISPDIFKHFIHWAYSRQFEVPAKDGKGTDFEVLLKLWVFGDAHEIPMLQNMAITTLHRTILKQWQAPSGFGMQYVFENTMPQSQLRRFLIDVWAGTCDFNILKSKGVMDTWCKDALIDLLQIVWRKEWQRSSKEALEKWDMCEYHVHEQGVRCSGQSLT